MISVETECYRNTNLKAYRAMDIRVAYDLKAFFQEVSVTDVRSVQVCPFTGPGFFLDVPPDGNATIHIYTSSHLCREDDKWETRPVPQDTISEFFRLIQEFADMVITSEAEEDSDSNAYEGGLPLDIECGGKDGVVQVFRFIQCFTSKDSLQKSLIELFDSIHPVFHDTKERLSHVSSIEYSAKGFPGMICARIVASRKLEGEGGTITYLMRFNSNEDYEGCRSLDNIEWNDFVKALAEAEILSWKAVYESPPVLNRSWRTLSIGFDDGWELHIQGSNTWDSRFPPIASAFAKYGVDAKYLYMEPSDNAMGPSMSQCKDEVQSETATESDMALVEALANLRRRLAEAHSVIVNSDGTVSEGEGDANDSLR